MRLASLTRPDLIFTDLPATDRQGALRALAERIAGSGLAPTAEDLFNKLWEREQLGSTGIGGGIAIPHCKLKGLARGVVAVGLTREGVSFGAADGLPVGSLLPGRLPERVAGRAPADPRRASRAGSRPTGMPSVLRELRDPQAIYDFLQKEGG